MQNTPELVLYLATGTATSSPAIVYQVNAEEDGRVMGKVKTPYTAYGIALHRTHGLILAVPRDGGKIMRIDESGTLTTIIEKDPSMPHPIDVGVSGESDTIVVADNIANQLVATSVGGNKPKVYQRLQGQQYTSQGMSVAVTNDKHVLFSSDSETVVFNFSGDQSAAGNKPMLPASGGVAADPNSMRWAVAQEGNQIYVYEGTEVLKKLRLPNGKAFYKNGLLSFSPAGSLVVAVRDTDKEVGEVWFLCYDIDKNGVKSLFGWNKEQIQDFTAGPRMLWEHNSSSGYKSKF